MLLEIAVFNIRSAIIAEASGAGRIELCENPYDGGTTPSYGTLKTLREQITIPVFPIIRPRGGDFLYDNEEFEVIKKDVLLCKSLGFEGIVTGLLLENGDVDIMRTRQLVDLAYPLEVTFHRAFDRARNPLAAMEAIIDAGCQRILTSGQVPEAFNGKELIKTLIEKGGDKIIIMPGSGVRSHNIKEILHYTGATEIHSSARKLVPSLISYQSLTMEENITNLLVDESDIKQMKSNIDLINL